MGTVSGIVEDKQNIVAIVLQPVGEILGPDSAYQQAQRALRKEYAPIVKAAKGISAIETQEEAEEAAKIGRLLHVAGGETEAFYKSIKVQLDAFKRPVLEDEKRDAGELDREKQRLGQLQTSYSAKVRREKEEADRKAYEEAERQAREDQLNRAVEMEQAGELEQAEATLEENPAIMVPITQAQAPPKIIGTVSKVNYSATVVDLMELVKAVAEKRVPIQALQPNESFINAQARAFKQGFAIPGCKLVTKEGTHFRA